MSSFSPQAESPEQLDELASLPASLAQRAIDLLHEAAGIEPDNPDLFVEERNIWQPDSWLLQRCWMALAEAGHGEEALAVAAFLELRDPLAPVQALATIAGQAARYPQLGGLVAKELEQLHVKLFSNWVVSDEARQTERLLLAAASAAQIGESSMAFSYLERLDQLPRAWDRILVKTELRALLAQTVAQVGLHPLTSQLITGSLRRFEDAGAQFLHIILSAIGHQVPAGGLSKRSARLLQRCVETFQYATLSSLTSRRLATIAFGQGGLVKEVLSQVTTIANVQEARRESGIFAGRNDPYFLRQVKRPTANADVDYQVYALQEAIKAMDVRLIGREDRIALADRVASLAVQSDGWTAAGAASTLVELGALKYAVDVVDFIADSDPTRSEGIISLVSALLSIGERALAEEQVEKALVWVKSFTSRNPERATIWGLADVYLDYEQPQTALRLLDDRYVPPGFAGRLRRLFANTVTDDELRDNRLRMQALLQINGSWSAELQSLYKDLCQWAPRLLDGEALDVFYVDGLLQPLLAAGETDRVFDLLPQVGQALSASSGDKHAVNVSKVANQLVELVKAGSAVAADGKEQDSVGRNGARGPEPAAIEIGSDGARAVLETFLTNLWQADAQKGIWQMIHSVEGSLPLLLALEGPQALVIVARAAANEGGLWSS